MLGFFFFFSGLFLSGSQISRLQQKRAQAQSDTVDGRDSLP